MQHFTGNFTPLAGARRIGHRQMRRRQQVQLNAREQTAFDQPFQAAKGVNSAPSILSGTMVACDFAATKAAPS